MRDGGPGHYGTVIQTTVDPTVYMVSRNLLFLNRNKCKCLVLNAYVSLTNCQIHFKINRLQAFETLKKQQFSGKSNNKLKFKTK